MNFCIISGKEVSKMIQDIAPHQFKNEYRPVSPQKDSIALYYEEHTALMRRTQTGIEFPTFGELEQYLSVYN